MIYFARIKAGNFHACGVFTCTDDASDTLGNMAEGTLEDDVMPDCYLYEHKPEHKMTEQDIADAGAMVVGGCGCFNRALRRTADDAQMASNE